MKLLHLSDLHLGKRVNEFSMREDQAYILQQILGIIDREQPDAVLIAGDVYDKSVPSADAVTMLDGFLVQLSERAMQTFLISGNHDSAERLAFGGRLMAQSGIHIAPVYTGTRSIFPEREIATYTDAMAAVLEAAKVDTERRNVLVTHQFVTGAGIEVERSDSEELSVGGTDNVDVSVFRDFDYVALGHIHRPQQVGRETVRYCGTPLKYSFSEAKHQKSVTVVELAQKGSVTVRTVPLTPLHDMIELRGTYNELMLRDFYAGTTWQEDYVHITLTDEDDIPNALANLRTVYHGLMKLDYDNRRTRSGMVPTGAADTEHKSPLTLLGEFYEQQNGQPMSEEQEKFAQDLIEHIWEGEE